MEEDLIISMWDVFKEYIPEKNREIAANHYVDFLIGRDVDSATLEGLIGYDTHLDQAIETVVGNKDEMESEDDSYDDGWDDDEDY